MDINKRLMRQNEAMQQFRLPVLFTAKQKNGDTVYVYKVRGNDCSYYNDYNGSGGCPLADLVII